MPLLKGCRPNCKVLHKSYWAETIYKTFNITNNNLIKSFEAWKKSDFPGSFDQYLSENFSDCRTTSTSPSKLVEYLSETERENYEVTFYDGKLIFQENFLNTSKMCPGEPPIFVISPSGKMYVGKPVVGKFHHSSFLSGAAVLGAGEIETDPEGRILKITNKSGHYKPTKQQTLNTLSFLSSKGICLEKTSLVEVGEPGKFYKSASEYLRTGGKSREDGISNTLITTQ